MNNIRLYLYIAFLWVLTLAVVGDVFGATYYLRADGTAVNMAAATGPCTSASTSATITTNNGGSFSPNDTIVVCGDGGIFRGVTLKPPSEGTAGNLISYVASGSPTITSRHLISGAWTGPDGDGDYSITAEDDVIVFWAGSSGESWGAEITKDSGVATNPADGTWNLDGSTIHYDPGASDPVPGAEGAFFEYGDDDNRYGIQLGNLSYIHVEGPMTLTRCPWHGYVTWGTSDGNNTINNVTATYNGNKTVLGAGLGNGFEFGNSNNTGTYLTASYNEDIGCNIELITGLPKPTGSIYQYCTISYNQDSGGAIRGGSDGGTISGSFLDNVVHHNGAEDEYGANGLVIGVYGKGTISRNLIYNNYGTGIMVRNSNALVVASEISNNIIYDNNLTDNANGTFENAGIALDVNYWGTVSIYNNVIYNSSGSNQDYGILQYYTQAADGPAIDCKNNIFDGHTLQHIYWSETAANTGTLVFDTNIMDFNDVGNHLGGTGYATLVAWNAISEVGTDIDDTADFVDASNANFKLLPSSPAIDAGTTPAGEWTDYNGVLVVSSGTAIYGSAIDIGAWEHIPLPARVPHINANSPLSWGWAVTNPPNFRR